MIPININDIIYPRKDKAFCKHLGRMYGSQIQVALPGLGPEGGIWLEVLKQELEVFCGKKN